MNKNVIKDTALCALFAAFMAVSALVSIPLPVGVSFTAQTFAVALMGFLLGCRRAAISVLIYLSLGAAGLPVFSNFSGGVGALVGLSSGFLWGFLPFAIICAASIYVNRTACRAGLILLSVLVLHFLGTLGYMIVSGIGPAAAFLAASLPFLPKDLIMCALAFLLSRRLRRFIR